MAIRIQSEREAQKSTPTYQFRALPLVRPAQVATTPSHWGASRANTRRTPCAMQTSPTYSAGTTGMASAGRERGSARRMNRSHAILISRYSRTQRFGERKWEANSRSISSGSQ